MKYIKLTCFFLITLLLLSSCDKNNITTLKDKATILFEGNPAMDGCGYFLLIKDTMYKPIELESEFSVDGLIVNVEYELLDAKWTCNWQDNKFSQIKIITISKK
ncbi:MAG: hypothetical protein M0Q90_04245 [Bacteroidales bacterium]|nr:hypothetical protein [Bacteroidales bacterium]